MKFESNFINLIDVINAVRGLIEKIPRQFRNIVEVNPDSTYANLQLYDFIVITSPTPVVVPSSTLFFTEALSPTLTCITADDILVKLRIMRGDEVIGTLSPLESISLEPGAVVNFEVVITSIKGETLPTFAYAWMDTGSVTDGELLHSDGRIVEYASGQKIVDDAISLQLSQPSCPTLEPYPFFVSPITATLTPTIPLTITPTPIEYATYKICDLGDGKVKVTLNPPEDVGKYSYSPIKEFEAQRDDMVRVVVKSEDGRVWTTTIHIDKDEAYPSCSSAP
jgi:hypothetical protein